MKHWKADMFPLTPGKDRTWEKAGEFAPEGPARVVRIVPWFPYKDHLRGILNHDQRWPPALESSDSSRVLLVLITGERVSPCIRGSCWMTPLEQCTLALLLIERARRED